MLWCIVQPLAVSPPLARSANVSTLRLEAAWVY
jgi:hypothetical protein